ncbi:MAG: hypothetical protein ACM3SP_03295 [Chloroflexota bacterium]
MKPLPAFGIVFLLSITVAGCALFAHKPLAGSALQGRLENNTYISPNGSFSFRMPWLAADATLRDETFGPDTVLVTVADDLCRYFIVSERPGYLGTQSLQSWVDEHIVGDLKRLGFDVRSQSLQTRNGPAIALRYRAPAAAPCSRVEVLDGKEVARKRDADVAWYVYHRNGRFFRLIYLIGIGPGSPDVWYVKREPVEEVLAQFADGFRILPRKDEGTRN